MCGKYDVLKRIAIEIYILVASNDAWLNMQNEISHLHLSLAELSHGLRALRDSVLGKLSRQNKADRGLHVATGHGDTAVDAAQFGRLSGNLLERVRDEIVNDRHAFLGDTRLRVHLLHDLEDVAVEAGLALAALDNRLFRNFLNRHR